MVKKPEYSVVGMLDLLKSEYKMSLREVAKYLGLTQASVVRWHTEECFPSEENYNAVQDILLRLSGRRVKYKGQAVDILNGEE